MTPVKSAVARIVPSGEALSIKALIDLVSSHFVLCPRVEGHDRAILVSSDEEANIWITVECQGDNGKLEFAGCSPQLTNVRNIT